MVVGIPQLEAAIAALHSHSCTVLGTHPTSVPSPAVLCNAMLHFDIYLCVPLQNPAQGMHSDGEQTEVVNYIVGCLLQRINKDWNYAWDMMLSICEYAVNLMDIPDEYFHIVVVLCLCS